jgi:hypothetical protein
MPLIRAIALTLLALPCWAGLYVDGTAWDRNDLNVCFESPPARSRAQFNASQLNIIPWTAQRRAQLRSWLEEEYRPARTGVHFVGFGDCNSVEVPDVVAFLGARDRGLGALFNPGPLGRASLGPDYARVPFHADARAYAWINGSKFTKSVVVHEFGHVARLAHEHFRPESRDDERCLPQHLQRGYTRVREIAYGDYDSASVMNYCNLILNSGQSRSQTGLSPGDVTLLRHLYSGQE